MCVCFFNFISIFKKKNIIMYHILSAFLCSCTQYCPILGAPHHFGPSMLPQKSRRKSTMDDTGEWSSESEGLDEEQKREQAEDIKKATRSEHRSYSRVVQVQLPRPREDQQVGNRARVKKERVMTGRRGPGVQHHLRGNRTTTRGRSSQKRNQR